MQEAFKEVDKQYVELPAFPSVMPVEEAEALYGNCTLLLLDLPKNIVIGLDYSVWRITENFHGVKLIPHGAHFLYWEPAQSQRYDQDYTKENQSLEFPDNSIEERRGIFLYFQPGDIIVKRWISEDGKLPFESVKKINDENDSAILHDVCEPDDLASIQCNNNEFKVCKTASVPLGNVLASESSCIKNNNKDSNITRDIHLDNESKVANTGHLCNLQDPDETERYILGIRRLDFDSGLAPYPLKWRKRWADLTFSITSDLIKQILPESFAKKEGSLIYSEPAKHGIATRTGKIAAEEEQYKNNKVIKKSNRKKVRFCDEVVEVHYADKTTDTTANKGHEIDLFSWTSSSCSSSISSVSIYEEVLSRDLCHEDDVSNELQTLSVNDNEQDNFVENKERYQIERSEISKGINQMKMTKTSLTSSEERNENQLFLDCRRRPRGIRLASTADFVDYMAQNKTNISNDDLIKKNTIEEEEDDELPAYIPGSFKGNVVYTDIPSPKISCYSNNKNKISNFTDLTMENMTQNRTLKKLFASYSCKKKKYAYKCLLGEYQLAYILFTLGQDYDSFIQWKRLTGIISSNDEWSIMNENVDFYSEFLRAFYSHIEQAPDDLLHDNVLFSVKDNFILHAICNLYDALAPCVVNLSPSSEDDEHVIFSRNIIEDHSTIIKNETEENMNMLARKRLLVTQRLGYLENLIKRKFKLGSLQELALLVHADTVRDEDDFRTVNLDSINEEEIILLNDECSPVNKQESAHKLNYDVACIDWLGDNHKQITKNTTNSKRLQKRMFSSSCSSVSFVSSRFTENTFDDNEIYSNHVIEDTEDIFQESNQINRTIEIEDHETFIRSRSLESASTKSCFEGENEQLISPMSSPSSLHSDGSPKNITAVFS